MLLLLRLREKVVVRQEESIDGTVKHDNLDLLIRLERRDDLVELGNRFRAEDVERRVIKRHTPVRGRSARQKYPFARPVGHGYSPFFTSAGVIALGCFVSPARRLCDSE